VSAASSSPPVPAAEWSATVSDESSGLLLKLTGTADLRVTEQVEKLLEDVHRRASSSGASEVRVDLRELEFMNSSCFKSFVTWISRVQQLPGESQYKIRFISSSSVLWQRRSLHALSCFAADLISIESMKN
jgi:hypothetical protein